MSAELRQQFALCITTLQQPFRPTRIVDPSAADIQEHSIDSDPKALNFSDEDLIEPQAPIETGLSPTDTSAADDQPADAPTTNSEPTASKPQQQEVASFYTAVTPPLLPATLERWEKRQAYPEVKELIKSVRARKLRMGAAQYKFYIPYDLRDKIFALRSKRLTEGPLANRQLLIQEYRLRQIRKEWNLE